MLHILCILTTYTLIKLITMKKIQINRVSRTVQYSSSLKIARESRNMSGFFVCVVYILSRSAFVGKDIDC